MFFILSKMLFFFIKPFNVIALLLLASFLIRNKHWTRNCRVVALVLFLFFTNGFIFNELLLRWEKPAIPIADLRGQYDFGIVLGGTTDTERTPKDRLFFFKGAERVTHALRLYKAGKIRHILFTGGNSKLFEDPEKDNIPIYNFYVMCGVRPEDIIIENKSRNTHENALFVKELMDSSSLQQRHILITSAFHMRRAEACFRKVGLKIIGFPTDFYTSLPKDRYSINGFIPSVTVLANWDFFIKELIGYVAYSVMGYI